MKIALVSKIEYSCLGQILRKIANFKTCFSKISLSVYFPLKNDILHPKE